MRSGMGTPAKGSPIPFWGALGRGVIQAGKWGVKNWKSLVAGEAAFYGAEKAVEGLSNQKGSNKNFYQKPAPETKKQKNDRLAKDGVEVGGNNRMTGGL